MDNYEELYDLAEGNFGLVTYAQAKAIGVSIRELDRWVKCGRLEKPTRGVYRVSRFPSSEKDPYAVATEAIGPEAYLYGESVLQLLNLVPTNPTWMYVASPKRVRKRHGESLVVLRGGRQIANRSIMMVFAVSRSRTQFAVVGQRFDLIVGFGLSKKA